MSIIWNVKDVKKKVTDDPFKFTIIDVRTKDKQFSSGEEAYRYSHIPGALFLDFHNDLTGEHSFLPPVDKLATTLGDLGINNDTTILFYDQGNHRAASKAWFVMEYLGHKNKHILAGGFAAWVDSGNAVETTVPKRVSTTYMVKPKKEIVVDIEGIKRRFKEEDSVLIDSRAYERYTGEVEPKYKKAGHIPGAINFHSKLVFDKEGLWKEKRDLQTHFASLADKEEVIVSCGSGNSACMNLVALKEAGFKDVKIYPGGFSEWIEDDENEVQTGEGK